MVKNLSRWLCLFALGMFVALPAAYAQNASTLGESAIQPSGIPECDSYFVQIEACIKTQIPASEYAELVAGLNEASRAFAAAPDKSVVAQQCTQALQQAKDEYAAKGCTFN